MTLLRKSAVIGEKQSISYIASDTSAYYSVTEQWDMVIIMRDKRDIRSGGMNNEI